VTATAGAVGAAYAVIEKNWPCRDCGADNFARRERCHKCKAARPAGAIALAVMLAWFAAQGV
jgi:predicted metal-binding protein